MIVSGRQQKTKQTKVKHMGQVRNASNIVKPTVAGRIPPHYKGVASFRIKSAKFGPSSGGLPMISVESEIIAPAKFLCEYDQNEYELTGLKVNWYWMLNEKNRDGKDSDNLFYFVNNLLPLLGLGNEVDLDNPLFDAQKNPSGIKLEGVCFDALCETEERIEQRKLPTGQYVQVINPATGQPLSRGWQFKMPQVKDIMRKIEAPSGNAPY